MTDTAPPPLSPARRLVIRWLQFNAVGGLGIAVQLIALSFLRGLLGLNYLLATACAVEIAILHNFTWHELWTWRDRHAGRSGAIQRLLRFNLTTGALSLAANLLLMRWLVGGLGIHYLPANLIAIASASIGNFLLSEFMVFRAAYRTAEPRA